MRTGVKTATIGALCVLIAAVGVGCSGDDDEGTKTVTVQEGSEQSPESTDETTATSEEQTDVSTDSDSEGSDAEELASGEGSTDGSPFRFVLTELKRSGQAVQVSARVENLSDDPDASMRILDAFGDNQDQQLSNGESEERYVFDGIALIDTDGGKKYLVARDETGRCVCSTDLADDFVEPDAPITLHATLSAPPSTVDTVDLEVQGVKTFTDVPIEG